MKKYIYNPIFANWLIAGGAKVIGAGIGKYNDAYILFEYNDTFQKLCDEWNPALKYRG